MPLDTLITGRIATLAGDQGFGWVEAVAPARLVSRIDGDFVGEGVWSISPAGDGTRAQLEWNVEVRKGVVRRLTPLLRPLFAWNHRWAMAKGEESLKLELARRHAKTAEEVARIPAPPSPTFPHNLLQRPSP